MTSMVIRPHLSPASMRSSRWPWLAAGLLGATLLLALGLVIQRGVRDGAARNADVAWQADAAWRCQAGRDRPGRQDCLQRARDLSLASTR